MGYTIWPNGSIGEVLQAVYMERLRQEELREKGKFTWSCAEKGISHGNKLAVLAEEFGEVAKEVTEEIILTYKAARDPCDVDHVFKAIRQRIFKELIQTAAVCVAWAEALQDE